MTTNQDKKIEPFYCKPASYEEAVEICERVVANGADKYEWPRPYEEGDYRDRTYPLSEHPLWGVRDDVTFCASLEEYFGDDAKEISIQQVRELYPFPDEVKEDQTIYVTGDKQEFVPEVNQECESLLTDAGYRKGRLKYKSEKMIVWEDSETGNETATRPESRKYRPIKTEAEIRREAEIQKIDRAYSYACGYALISANNMSESLYNQGVRVVDENFIEEAAKEKGYIKTVELTDDDIENLEKWSAAYDIKVLARAIEKHIKGEA